MNLMYLGQAQETYQTDMSISGAGGMGIMRFVAGYVLYAMIMFWFGPKRFEWVNVWGFKNYRTFSVVYVYFA